MAEAAALVFEAVDLESCAAIVRQFFREHPSANINQSCSVDARSQTTGARIWRIIDGNLEAATDIVVGFIMTQPRGAVTISARDT
jgi:hypothetical protein